MGGYCICVKLENQKEKEVNFYFDFLIQYCFNKEKEENIMKENEENRGNIKKSIFDLTLETDLLKSKPEIIKINEVNISESINLFKDFNPIVSLK